MSNVALKLYHNFNCANIYQAAWLEKEIRKLGGRVEYFFGKEVQYLITDKPQMKDAVPPCSPFSNPGPSPFSRPELVVCQL